MKVKMDGFKKALAALLGLFLLLFGPTLFFLADGNEVAAAVTGTLTVGTLFAITHVLAFAGGAFYTKSAMAMGGSLVLRAQETNDRWDERKTAAFGKLMQEGARIGRQAAGGQDGLPALPLPSQGLVDWMPAPSTFDVLDADEDWRP